MQWVQRLRENLSVLEGNLLVLTLSWMLWFPAMRMTNTYSQRYITALGATPFIFGVINAVSMIAVSIVRIPGGYIADRYGRKKIVSTMTFGVALAYLFYAFASSWEWILIGATVSNLFLIYQPALMAIRADSVPAEKRGTGFALANFLPRLICIPAPIIALYLVDTFELIPGMRIAYLAATSLGVG
ncbi:MAG: MFS transporter, partial [Thermoproteota archaeon]|nr:MFS transporter [Thermoproteota archaeon]